MKNLCLPQNLKRHSSQFSIKSSLQPISLIVQDITQRLHTYCTRCCSPLNHVNKCLKIFTFSTTRRNSLENQVLQLYLITLHIAYWHISSEEAIWQEAICNCVRICIMPPLKSCNNFCECIVSAQPRGGGINRETTGSK